MKKFSILSTLLIFFGVCCCVSCGWFFSNVLISTGLFSTTTTVNNNQQQFYAISMASNESAQPLESLSASLQAQNGAGFVCQLDNKFHLIASIYENKADAEHVKDNLQNQGTASEILTVKTSQIKLEGNFSGEEKTVLNDCLKAKYQTFKKLYDVAISLDTAVLDTTKAKLECNNIYSGFVTTKANFETMFGNKDLQIISKELESIQSQLSKLIAEDYVCETQTFSSLIKLSYCKILLG